MSSGSSGHHSQTLERCRTHTCMAGGGSRRRQACSTTLQGTSAMPKAILALLLPLLFLARAEAAVDAEQRLHKKTREQWDMCSTICKEAAGNRLSLNNMFTIRCFGGSRQDGVLRVHDKWGVEIFAIQACSYSASRAKVLSGKMDNPPLWITRKGAKSFQLEFHYPKGSAKRISVLAALSG
mmetsp:Transcript_68289/g.121789  ORF Transcript_68289/g.121789 Transcript_68289/m.121789 type:complete len:181 (-) Transcript_68289:86-628(-)